MERESFRPSFLRKKEILQRNRWHEWHSNILFKIREKAEQSFQGKPAQVLTFISLDKMLKISLVWLNKVDTFCSNTFINHTDVHLITAWVLNSFRIFHHDQPDHSEPWVTAARMAAIKMAVELRGVGWGTWAPCGPDPLAPLLGAVRTYVPLLPHCLSNNSLCWVSTPAHRPGPAWLNKSSRRFYCRVAESGNCLFEHELLVFKCFSPF